MISIDKPFVVIPDIDGQPVDNGYVYIGAAGLNPEVNPVSIFWDDALTIPAVQPVRTINGFYSQNGTPGKLFTSASQYSMLVRNKNNTLVYSSLYNSNQTAEAGTLIFSTVAALKAASLSIGSYAKTQGYYIAGDGGQAEYLIASFVAVDGYGDHTLTNGNVALLQYSDQINTKQYGAKGDGVTDDTASIQAAWDRDAGIRKTVLFPEGTYVCGRVNMNDNLHIITKDAIIQPPAAVPTNVLWYSNAAYNAEISGFKFNVNKTTYPNLISIYGDGSTNLHVHDCHIEEAGRFGVYINDCIQCIIERVNVITYAESGIVVDGTGSLRNMIRNCYVNGVGINHGIQVQDGDDCQITQNMVTNCAIFGVNGNRATRLLIADNIIFDTIKEGINIQDSDTCTIARNSVFWSVASSEDFGISIYGANPSECNFNKVHDNIVTGANKSGIAIADTAKFNDIFNNKIINCNTLNEAQGSGVLLYDSDCQYNRIHGNTVLEFSSNMKYGVNEYNSGGSPSNNRIANNEIIGVATSKINKVLTTIAALNNEGYKTWNPTIAAGTGTLTTVGTVTARYYEIEKMVFFTLAIAITTNGTGATDIRATLPFTSSSLSHMVSGRESGVSGVAINGSIAGSATQVVIRKYDNSYPAADGAVMELSGFFERA